MRLSVIVPVYNAEKYLQRCLDSLLDQGLDEADYEVICVDDGSVDESVRIVESYAERGAPTVRLFRQGHAGAAAARNLGLDKAQGEVVTFCDADDYLIPKGLGYVLDAFWKEDTEVLCHASTTLDAIKLKTWQEDNKVVGHVIREGTGRMVYESDPKYFVWNTLVRRSYLQSLGLRFRPLTMTEDSCFMLELMMNAAHAVDVSSNIYRYTVNDTQITRQRDPQLMRQCIDGYLHLLSLLDHYGLPHVMAFQRTPFYSRVLSANLNKTEYAVLADKVRTLTLSVPPYGVYVLASAIHRKVLVPYVLPHLRRG